MNVSEAVGLLGKGKGAKIAHITYRAKETHEKAKHTALLGVNTRTLYEKDRDTLAADIIAGKYAAGVERQAAEEVLASLHKSMERMDAGVKNEDYALKDVRLDVDGVPGVWIHKETGVLYAQGVVEHKTIIEAGEYKTVKSSEKTLAKQAIEKTLRKSKIRTFIIKRIGRIAAYGEVIEIEAEDE